MGAKKPNRGVTKTRYGGQNQKAFPMREPNGACGGQNTPFNGFGSTPPPPRKILDPPLKPKFSDSDFQK